MGSGFKDFAAGNVLTASDVDNYLMRQTMMTFASTAAHDSALSGVLAEGMVSYQTDTNGITYYTGAAWRTIYLPETTWTPTWSNLTVGNGTLVANYSRTGDLVNVFISLTFGTTTSISGSVTITNMPGSIAPTVSGQCLSVIFSDASASDILGMCRLSVTTFFPRTSAGAALAAAVPYTWTSTDVLLISGTYLAS